MEYSELTPNNWIGQVGDVRVTLRLWDDSWTLTLDPKDASYSGRIKLAYQLPAEWDLARAAQTALHIAVMINDTEEQVNGLYAATKDLIEGLLAPDADEVSEKNDLSPEQLSFDF